MYCVFLVMCRVLRFQRLVLSGCDLPGWEAGRKKLGGDEREKEGATGREALRDLHVRTQGALSWQLYKVIYSANQLEHVPG